MMFYTFEQQSYRRNRQIERFVIVEADDDNEARERASYFGIDFSEELSGGDQRWWENRDGGWRQSEPLIAGYNIHCYTNHGGWVVLYKDDNINSSRAILFEDEHDPEYDYYSEHNPGDRLDDGGFFLDEFAVAT